MAHYSFTLRVTGLMSEGFENALYEAGCDDALVAVVDGALEIDFDREALSFEHAVSSATRNVEKAGGRVVKVERI